MIFLTVFMLVIAIVMFTMGTILVKKSSKTMKEVNDNWERRECEKVLKGGRLIRFLCVIPLVILLLATIFSGIRIIDSTSVGVVKHLGVINSTISAGLNFTNPYFDTVEKYDLKVHVGNAEFASYTKDAQPVTAVIEYQFEMDPAYALDIAKTYGTQEMHEAKIGNIVEEKTKSVFARYGAMSLLENRANLSTEIDQSLTPLEEMFHITFKSVIVKDLDFSDAFEKSVEAKMEAEQNALKAEQEKKRAIIEAEQVKAVAEIEAEAAIAAANGEAEAMMIKKEALDKMPANYTELEWIEKWNGVLPWLITEGSGIMLAPNINPNIE